LPSIYIQMLCPLALVSSIRCFLFYNTGLQLECDNLRVAQLPHPTIPIPLATRLLHLLPDLDFGKTHTHSHNRVSRKTRRWRVPLALGNDELHSLEALLLLCIVAIAHTDQTVAVLCEQLLGAFLARLEMQRSTHANHLINSLVTAQGQMHTEPNGSCSQVLAMRPTEL